MTDLFAAGGKRVRPALVLLSARCGNYDIDQLTPAAMAVELTHAATLVHDDVIDRSPVRRGRPTVAASLGDEPAIVIGDFYFAKAYEHAARTESTEVVGILAQAVMEICAGEVRQQAIRYRYSTGVDEYMYRIEAKTATLLAACCDIGAALAGVSPGQRSALHEYGRQWRMQLSRKSCRRSCWMGASSVQKRPARWSRPCGIPEHHSEPSSAHSSTHHPRAGSSRRSLPSTCARPSRR